MKIINHGKWSLYTPDPWPGELPQNVVFAKRDEDAMDWYQYINDASNFEKGSLFAVAHYRDFEKAHVLGMITNDVTGLFPRGHYMVEIVDYDNSMGDLMNKVYDPETNEVLENTKLQAAQNDTN